MKKVSLLLLMLLVWTTPALAHKSPDGCNGSGLGINLSTDKPQVHVGDVITFSVEVFNGIGTGPVVCDVSGIQASVVTPDGLSQVITLTRTALTNGQKDFYPNVASYTARDQDVGTMTATASDTGDIHQNVVDSRGGGNQGVNVTVLAAPAPSTSPTPTITPSITPTPSVSATPSSTPPPVTSSTGSGGGGYPTLPVVTPVVVTPIRTIITTVTTTTYHTIPKLPNTGFAPENN